MQLHEPSPGLVVHPFGHMDNWLPFGGYWWMTQCDDNNHSSNKWTVQELIGSCTDISVNAVIVLQ